MAHYETRDSRGPAPRGGKKAPDKDAAVAQPGWALSAMSDELTLISTLIGGTNAMQEAGHEYLPQHDYETNKSYRNRLQATVLDNFTKRTLSHLTGKAFREPPQPTPDTDPYLVEFMSDVDGAGTGFIPFTRSWFRSGIRGSVAYALAETPSAEEGENRSKADDAVPTWRLIHAEDMLDYQEGKIADGTIRPTLARFRDDVVEDDGNFGSVLVERVRVIKPNEWELWERKTGPRGGQAKWVVTDKGTHDLDFVPVVPFYTDKEDTGYGRSPLADLAHLNKRHWQSTSDQTNILTVTRFPILAGSGITDGDDVTIGPKKFLATKDPNGKIYWVEHAGTAVESGDKDLTKLEKAMAAYGAQFMEEGTAGPETASGRIIDDADATTELQAWGLDFKDAMELLLHYTAILAGLGEDADVSVLFDVDSSANVHDSAELNSIEKARERREISRMAYINELKRRGILDEEYNAEDDQEELDSEAPPAGSGLDGMNAGLAGGNEPPKPAPGKEPPPTDEE